MNTFAPPGFAFVRTFDNGFFGPTYLVRELETNSLKVCKLAYKSRIGNSDAVQRFVERQDHINSIQSPFIVPYTKITEEKEYLVLIRNYIDFPSLNQSGNVMSDEISYNSRMAMWKIIIRTFAHLHSHHIYPTIIRPNNLFLVNNQYILVTDIYTPSPDFDIMSRSPNSYEIGFLAPEFFTRNSQPQQSADVWSLGVILFFILTNRLPWDKKNVFSIVNQITNAEMFLDDCDFPNEVLEILSAMIVVDPNQRTTLDKLTNGKVTTNKKIVHSLDSSPVVCIALERTHRDCLDLPESSPILHPAVASKTMSKAGYLMLNSNVRKQALIKIGGRPADMIKKPSVPDMPFFAVRKRAIQ